MPLTQLHKSDRLSIDQVAIVETLGIGAHAVSRGNVRPGEDGVVVGSGGITVYDSPPGPGLAWREAYVMSMYTEPGHRGRGVARAVLAALLEFARAAGGVGRVWLRASAMGRSLYLGAGFEPRDSYLQLHLDR